MRPGRVAQPFLGRAIYFGPLCFFLAYLVSSLNSRRNVSVAVRNTSLLFNTLRVVHVIEDLHAKLDKR